MNRNDFLIYQTSGKYIPGKLTGAMSGNTATGYNVLNNDAHSSKLLSEIRQGIFQFYTRMDQLHGSSVMTKYYDQMITSEASKLGFDQYSEKFIPAVYETIIAETIRMNQTTNGAICTLPNVIAYAAELCWDWMCSFWLDDVEREPVDETYKLDYASRAKRVTLEYAKLCSEMLVSEGMHIDGLASSVKKLAAMSQAKTKPISLTQIASGKGITGKVPMPNDEAYNYRYLDPEVEKMLDSSEREYNKRLELEARAKRTVEQLGKTTAVKAGDPGMGYATEIAVNTPTNFNIPTQDEETTMFYAQNPAMNTFAPQNNILVNFQNQPICNAQGQTIQYNPADVAHLNGSFYQLQDNGKLVFDSVGMPIVILRTQTGEELLFDLTGQQQAWFNQWQAARNAAPQNQQQQSGLFPVGGQQQQQQPPQQYQQPAATDNVDMSIPGMEFATMTTKSPAFETTQQTSDCIHTNGFAPTVDEYTQPAPAAEQTVAQEETAEDVLGADYRFYVNINGVQHPAAIWDDEDYAPKSFAPLTVLINPNTHARAIAYIGDDAVEFCVHRERFMQREKHLGYIMSSQHGEYVANEAVPVVAENVGQATPNFPPVKVNNEILISTNWRDLSVQARLTQLNAADPSSISLSPFELREETAILNVPDEVFDMFEDEHPLQSILSVYEKARELKHFDLCTYITDTYSPLVTDIVYNRICIERSTQEDIRFPHDVEAVCGYLNEIGKLEEFYEELKEVNAEFFNVSNDGISFTPAEDEIDDFDFEEPEVEKEDEVEEAPKPAAYMLVNEKSGYVACLAEFQLTNYAHKTAVLDPVQDMTTWSCVAGLFDKIPSKPGRTEYVYITNSRSECFVFACEDVEFGLIRLMGIIKG